MSSARFSIIPAWVVTDSRLKGSDLKVICLLGRHTNKEGWCRRSQVKMADELGCGRSTVQDSLNRLAEIGAVERRVVDSPDGRDSAHWYRVVLDRALSGDAFSAYEDEDDKEFGPIDGAEYGTPPAGIPAPPAGPRPAPPAGSGPAPINVTLNGSSNDIERESGREGAIEDRKKVERDFKKWFPTWPTYLADSENSARKAWFELSTADRAVCIEKTEAYVAAVKASGRTKWHAAGVYLATKAWQKLDDPKSDIAPPSVHDAYTRPWMALRLAELLKPPITSVMPAMTIYQRQQVALGGESARQIELERRRAYGWPKVNAMDSKAAAIVPAALVTLSEQFVGIRRGSAEAFAWRAVHDRMGWRWLPDGVEWIQMPPGDPEAAIAEFQARLSEGKANDDAA